MFFLCVITHIQLQHLLCLKLKWCTEDSALIHWSDSAKWNTALLFLYHPKIYSMKLVHHSVCSFFCALFKVCITSTRPILTTIVMHILKTTSMPLGRGVGGGNVGEAAADPDKRGKGGRPTSGLCIRLGELESWTVVEESAVVIFSSWLLFKQRFHCAHNHGRILCTSTGGWRATHWWLVSFFLCLFGPFSCG